MVVRMNADNFEQKAKDLHGDRYDYSNVNYTGANTKVTIICSEHGEFQQTPSKHVNSKHGCPKCSGTDKLTVEEFIAKAKQAHGTMADRLDYSKVLTMDNTATKVEIICKLHGSFHMTPMKHMAKQGCKKCKSTFSLSAIAWLEYVARTQGIRIKHALRGGEERFDIGGKIYFVDGFCSESNTVFQFHGNFFHGNPQLYKHDELNKRVGKTFGELYEETKRVEKLIVSKGYELVTIWEKDWEALCLELGLDPREPCNNPDYKCPTAADRKAANRLRERETYNKKLESDPEFRKQILAKQKKYRENHKEDLRQYHKTYYAKNKDKIMATHAEYVANNSVKVSERTAVYRQKNKDKRREYDAVRRAENNQAKSTEKMLA